MEPFKLARRAFAHAASRYPAGPDASKCQTPRLSSLRHMSPIHFKKTLKRTRHESWQALSNTGNLNLREADFCQGRLPMRFASSSFPSQRKSRKKSGLQSTESTACKLLSHLDEGTASCCQAAPVSSCLPAQLLWNMPRHQHGRLCQHIVK